jgi:hypothetical protein
MVLPGMSAQGSPCTVTVTAEVVKLRAVGSLRESERTDPE